ncbi:MAG: spondin domain-containing protein [Methylococcaceae bacterium]
MKKIQIQLIGLTCLISTGLVGTNNAFAHDYEVTVTNITQGQVFTPILSFIHQPGISAFTLGQPALSQVASIAEAGNTAPALEVIATLPNLISGATDTGAPLPPGKSVTIELDAVEGMTRISLLAMLIPTNDAFFGLNGKELPEEVGDTVTYRSVAYDAGTEANDELCTNIPGPADVCSGEGESASDGEGFVHVHPGIHGIADLPAERYDWRNPVAQISISRVVEQ